MRVSVESVMMILIALLLVVGGALFFLLGPETGGGGADGDGRESVADAGSAERDDPDRGGESGVVANGSDGRETSDGDDESQPEVDASHDPLAGLAWPEYPAVEEWAPTPMPVATAPAESWTVRGTITTGLPPIPLAYARVEIRPFDPQQPLPEEPIAVAVSGPAGTFAIEGMEAGRYHVRLEKPYHKPEERRIIIGPDGAQPMRVQLQRFGVMVGQLRPASSEELVLVGTRVAPLAQEAPTDMVELLRRQLVDDQLSPDQATTFGDPFNLTYGNRERFLVTPGADGRFGHYLGSGHYVFYVMPAAWLDRPAPIGADEPFGTLITVRADVIVPVRIQLGDAPEPTGVPGRVVWDLPSEWPIAEAQVTINKTAGSFSESLGDASAVVTDEDGRFFLQTDYRGPVRVAIHKARVLPDGHEMTTSLVEGQPLVIRVPAGAALRGTLFGPDGDPAVRQLVRLERVPDDGTPEPGNTGRPGFTQSGGSGPRVAPVQSDAEGRFQFVNVLPGRYILSVDPSETFFATQQPIELVAGENQTSITLEQGSVVRLRFVDQAGQPTEPGQVRVQLEREPMVGIPPATIGESGPSYIPAKQSHSAAVPRGASSVELHAVYPGPYRIIMQHQSWRKIEQQVEIRDTDEEQEFDVVLDAGGTITGRVTDAAGEPISGGTAIWTPQDGERDRSSSPVRDGEFRMIAVKEGPGVLEVYTPDRVPHTEELSVDGEQSVTVTLQDGIIVEGRIVTPDGSAPSEGVLEFFPADTPLSEARRRPVAAQRRAEITNGEFEIVGIAPGSYRVVIYDAGVAYVGETPTVFLPPAEPPVVNVAGPVATVEIEVRAGLTLSGEVLVPSGEANRVLIQLMPLSSAAGGASGQNPLKSTTTDASGRFRFPGLPAGAYRVVAQHPTFGSAARSLTLSGNQSISIQLEAGYELAGTVTGLQSAGVALPRVIAERVDPDGANQDQLSRRRSAMIDRSGSFRVSGLTSGEWQIQVVGSTTGLVLAEERVRVGETNPPPITLAITPIDTATIAGYAVDPNGNRLSNMTFVFASVGTETMRFSARTDTSGRFSISQVPTGDYIVTPIAIDGRAMSPTSTITLGPEGIRDRAFRIDGTVNGVRLLAIHEGGAADQVGLQRGDLVTRYGSDEIRSMVDLAEAIQRGTGGTEAVFIRVERDGRAIDVQIAPGPIGADYSR